MCGSVIVNPYSFSLLATSCMDSLPKHEKGVNLYMHIYRSADWLRATALTYAQADLLPCDRLCEATIPPTWPIAFSLHYFEPLDIACFASGQPRSVSCIAWGQTPPPSDRLRLRL